MLRLVGAGDPASLFHATEPLGWARGLGIVAQVDSPEGLRRVFAAALRRGLAGGHLFGVRQQPNGFPALCSALARAYPDATTDPGRMVRAFGPLRFLHLRREDRLAQAISYLRAEISGLWHLGADGQPVERNAPVRAPGYDARAIHDTVTRFTLYEARWHDWFAQTGVTPLHLTYEDLARDPKAQLARVLTFLDLPPEAAATIEPPLVKLADQTTEDWIARYTAAPYVPSL